MRCDQYMGLTITAQDMIEKEVETNVKEVITFPDGTVQEREFTRMQSLVEVSEYDQHQGMFGDTYSLDIYTMPDGSRFREFVQAEPWSSGPVFFYALEKFNADNNEWEVVNESLWPEEEINRA